ncbi:MAG: DUF2877 domain-containing protein [Dehalococcoidia bacterium]|nr:DUF2877 domain-containing protein [Dehalococcoidia bacterium]
MPTMDGLRIFRVTALGMGLPGLHDPQAEWGRVAAVFRSSCHVMDSGGRVACIVDGKLGNGPVNVCVDLPDGLAMEDLDAAPGAPLTHLRGHLRLGDGLLLDLSGAQRWTPPPVGPRAPAAEVRRRVRALGEALAPRAPGEGLAPMALLAEGIAWGQPVEPEPEPVTAAALPRVSGLVHGLLSLDAPMVHESAAGLVGLGPGLTPSGDDYLAGLLVAMTCSEAGPAASVLGDSVAALAPDRTTALGATLLSHAAAGAGSEDAHLLLAAILGPGGRSDAEEAALSLTDRGHTSGWDTLAGLLLGVHLGVRLGDSGGDRLPECGSARVRGAR